MNDTSTSILAVGEPAPTILFHDHGVERSVADGDGAVWVLFYPLAFAPTCRDDLRNLQAAAEDLGHPRAHLLVISVDRTEQAHEFLKSLGAEALVAVEDPSLELARAFGVARREGVTERATFLIHDGKVVHSRLHDLCLPRPVDELRAVWRTLTP